MSRGRHHGDAAEADDVGREIRRPFGKQDFVYIADEDVYRCPAGERLTYRYTNEEDSKMLRRYCGWPQAHGRIRAKVMTVAAILNMANVRAIKIASRIETSLTDSR